MIKLRINDTRSDYVAIKRLLETFADEFANHGCNDFEMENTDENWDLVLRVRQWSNDSEPAPVRPPPNKLITIDDWIMARYFADHMTPTGIKP